MKKGMYFIHDLVSGEYKGPFLYSTEAEALRDFMRFCRENKDVPVIDLELIDSGFTIDYEEVFINFEHDRHCVALGRSILNDNSEA